MRLQLEFENADLREMITDYFKASGFVVKNLDQLCEFFHKAFPDGIKVQAETIAYKHAQDPDGRPVKPAVGTHSAVPELPAKEDPTLEKNDGTPNVIMSASDLFDPTPGQVPTRDEQLRQAQAELKHILAQSKVIEETKESR